MNRFRQLLEQELIDTANEETRIDIENKLAFDMPVFDAGESIRKSQQIIERCQSLPESYQKGIAHALTNIGTKNIITGNLEAGYNFLEEAERIFQSLNLNEGIAFAQIIKSNYHWARGRVNPAMDLLFNGLRLIEGHPDPQIHGWGHYFLGTFYSDLNEFEDSLKHLSTARDYFEQSFHEDGLARSHNSITLTYRRMGDYEKAIHHCQVSLAIYKVTTNLVGIARSLTDLGSLLVDTGQVTEGIEKLVESLDIRRLAKNNQAIITTLTELGIAYDKAGSCNQSLENFNEALLLARQEKSLTKQIRILKELSRIEKKHGKFQAALELLEEAYKVESEQLKQDAEARVRNIEDRLEAQNKSREAEIERLRSIELKKAYDLIEEKNQSITDSIRYAKTIQSAILPGDDVFSDCFNDFFIFYSPRDIVSGDFYWAKRKENLIQMAVIDCTGHGVPGALMSMLGFSVLNQSFDTVPTEQPGLVLDLLREGIVNALRQASATGSRDGMDVAFVNIDLAEKNIYFAGANRPLLIVRKDGSWEEIKGDKFPAGIHPSFQEHDFAHHKIPYQPGDIIYLFTDGFPDQFGGERGKKYKYRRFRDFLISNAGLPVSRQKELLQNEFQSWKGDLEQIDDVTVAGIRL